MTKSLLVICCLCLASCANKSVEQVRYYLLDSPSTSMQTNVTQGDSQSLALLKTVKVAEYLSPLSMAMMLGENEIYYSKKHAWAESLSAGISKALRRDLNRQAPDWRFITAAESTHQTPEVHIDIEVEHWLATDRASVIASGRYQISAQNAHAPLCQRDFSFDVALEQDGFAHAVSQMRGLVSRLSEQIIIDVREACR